MTRYLAGLDRDHQVTPSRVKSRPSGRLLNLSLAVDPRALLSLRSLLPGSRFCESIKVCSIEPYYHLDALSALPAASGNSVFYDL